MPGSEDIDGPSVDSERLREAVFAKLFDVAPRAVMLGRYRVLDELGAGGMGRVFRAHDEQLDRQVAIKVVERSVSRQGAVRLRREALALARLAHPNVVVVHEVGEHGGQVFIVMEYVRGQTLRAWQQPPGRSPPEVLAVYLQAARGLAAAHEAGVLHRDFKPDNAILGDDGRLRVVDFGLARGVADGIHDATDPSGDDGDRLDSAITRTGSLLGTPAYMAPEQHRRAPTDARTDQFAFCVALWEALYGQRPFAGTTVAELATHVSAGTCVPAPSHVRVGAAVRSAIARGLATRPDERHQDMNALVAILGRAVSPSRGRWWIPATVVPTLGALTLGLALWRGDVAVESCPPTSERLAGVWDDEVRAGLAARFAAVPQRPYVMATWRSFERAVDSVVTEWSEVHDGACRATHAEDQTARRFAARRLDCLDGALSTLGVIVDGARTAEPEDFARSYPGWIGLRPRLTCATDEIVQNTPPGPTDPTLAAEVAALRVEVQRAVSATASGQPRRGLELGEEAVRRARAIDHRPVLGEALATVGLAQLTLQDPRAQASLAASLREHERAGHDLGSVEVLLGLARVDDHPIETLDRADALIERLGSPAEARLASTHVRIAALTARGERGPALTLAQDTAASFGEDATVPALLRAQVYLQLAAALDAAATHDRALAAARRAVAIFEQEFGPRHPIAATAMEFVARALLVGDHYAEALAAQDEIIAVLEVAYPDGHPRMGWTLIQRALALLMLGRFAEAEQSCARAEAALTQTLGADHTETLRGPALYRARLAVLAGDVETARAIATRLRRAGFVDPSTRMLDAVIFAWDGQADAARATLAELGAAATGTPANEAHWMAAAYVEIVLGDLAAAHGHAERAVPLAPPGFMGGGTLAMAGSLRVDRGDFVGALPLLEDAVTRAATAPAGEIAWFSALAHSALARALHETGGDHARAVRLAKTAIAQAKLTGPVRTGAEQKAAAWLAVHDR